jgi:hypothetical protein
MRFATNGAGGELGGLRASTNDSGIGPQQAEVGDSANAIVQAKSESASLRVTFIEPAPSSTV